MDGNRRAAFLAAGLFLDAELASSESFFLQLAGTPTTATIYSLNIDAEALSKFGQGNLTREEVKRFLENSITSQGVTFSSAIPEPSAALVFAVGLLVTGRAWRRA